MIRATTPTHTFNIHTDDVKVLLITYKQQNEIILEKGLDEVNFEDGIISYTLTQDETNLFDEGTAEVQVRILTNNDIALASKQFAFYIDDVLDDEVLE